MVVGMVDIVGSMGTSLSCGQSSRLGVVDVHVAAANVPRMAVLNCGVDRGCCDW